MCLRGKSNIIELEDLFFHRVSGSKKGQEQSCFVMTFEYAEKGDLHGFLRDIKKDVVTG
jgi:hypothetical protein